MWRKCYFRQLRLMKVWEIVIFVTLNPEKCSRHDYDYYYAQKLNILHIECDELNNITNR